MPSLDCEKSVKDPDIDMHTDYGSDMNTSPPTTDFDGGMSPEGSDSQGGSMTPCAENALIVWSSAGTSSVGKDGLSSRSENGQCKSSKFQRLGQWEREDVESVQDVESLSQRDEESLRGGGGWELSVWKGNSSEGAERRFKEIGKDESGYLFDEEQEPSHVSLRLAVSSWGHWAYRWDVGEVWSATQDGSDVLRLLLEVTEEAMEISKFHSALSNLRPDMTEKQVQTNLSEPFFQLLATSWVMAKNKSTEEQREESRRLSVTNRILPKRLWNQTAIEKMELDWTWNIRAYGFPRKPRRSGSSHHFSLTWRETAERCDPRPADTEVLTY